MLKDTYPQASNGWSSPSWAVPSKDHGFQVRHAKPPATLLLQDHPDHFIGKVLNIGADWLLVDSVGNARPDTRYNIQADDGTYIYVQTEGPTLKDGRTLHRGKFERNVNGTNAWMNDVVVVGVLTVNGSSQVLIDMWEVVPWKSFERGIRNQKSTLDRVWLEQRTLGIHE